MDLRFGACRSALPLLVPVLVTLGTITTAQRSWTWTEEAKITAADGVEDDSFGFDVALDGDTAVIGAPGDFYFADPPVTTGKAYVFVRSGTTWAEQADLIPADATLGDFFGGAVALDGDTALVSSHMDDAMGTFAGSAYVFVRTGTTWSEQAKLLPSGTNHVAFGLDVALHGDTALVGSPGSGLGGSAFVFVRSGTVWTQQQTLSASDAEFGDAFGNVVALHGDTALVTSAWDDDARGAVYAFVRTGTTWSQQAKLLASDGYEAQWFGHGLALEGDTAIIGARRDAAWRGAAYVFVRAGTTWGEQAKLLADDGEASDQFGLSVALRGDTLIVGAPSADGLAHSSAGAAYVFVGAGASWTQQAKLFASDGQQNDKFGCSVAVDGETALLGASKQYKADQDDGAAYAFGRTAPASATFRNAGVNPASYAAVTLPVLGTTYTGTVDLAGTSGHDFAWLVGYATPFTLPLGGGQTLLVNVADPDGELLMQPMLPGPVATYHLPVPSDVAFVGFTLSSQALHVGGIQPFAGSNAQDLFLGL